MSVGKMTGPKKAAILLLALGEDGAADVMKNLEEAEIQQVGYYMSRFTDVSPEELDIVLEEFYRNSVMADEGVNISSSPDFVKNALTKALGADRAKELSDNLGAGEEEAGLEALRYAEPIMIANYIRTEHPQTIALILSYLKNAEQSSAVLRDLPESLQADILYRMAVIESIPPGVISEMNEVLTEEMKTAGSMATSVGGVEPVAEILNSVDKATETRILSSIEETNPDLAEQIRELMFTFEDMALIDAKQMQLVMKDVDQADMVLALKTASDAVKELIFSSMSSRAAEMVREDLENLGPAKLSDVEAAQQKIIKVVKKLEEAGTIIIAGAGGGDLV
ncbi:MAG TPA: flagellar motor switch protein FliG [Deltaproteobacteria bacterium]|jgi:flagellar motor switch protein FliG|uniref:Flagellar motor switch protein FliG n=2 Tax=Deltaproteobacteria TaxID=28221 RepID=E0XVI9_9DELT|nr:flagellar motor switch protein [uncultured delta proteobacterium HF4000_08N17]MCH2282328.1 flagellar motor switch protein FliG [SAR324 cluster bacterium]RTZ88420.1 MAG: flagellar motor switch protein FliG [SAR324 cluster bacterium]HBJ48011.1 flagellar motor switch protein FliG [Deltaproteobacteria bacterium]